MPQRPPYNSKVHPKKVGVNEKPESIIAPQVELFFARRTTIWAFWQVNCRQLYLHGGKAGK